ncbi:hypothetical protein [Cesiribacter sp. SM1]|uniref:hypothetical protein n=1 Tax=Cesiribacter sp. SM1 TaxID=2861196 RepID=UPI001CD1B8F8|nr:hypothetical protein [Cesiribacter sp. SM1]
MIVVLREELLYKKGETRIFKTYNPELHRYGLFMPISSGAKKYKAVFLHIFKYEYIPTYGEERAAVVTYQEEYKWLDLSWKNKDMTPGEQDEWSSYLIKNSVCLCRDSEALRRNCKLCGAYGQIENPYAERHLNKFLGW